MDPSAHDSAESRQWIPRQDLRIQERRLPHWRMDGAWYFITFRTWQGALTKDEIALVRQHIIDGAPNSFHLSSICVMPDHVHLILSPLAGVSLSKVMQKIKGTSALLVNRSRGSRGRLWQVESWDRIIRDDDELYEKLAYMLRNPVKEGLTDDPWTWIGWYLNPNGLRDAD